MSRPWFDEDSGVLKLDEYVMESPSFKTIMADGVVTERELAGQAERVVARMKELEERLDGELHSLATEVLVELAVLYAARARSESHGA